LKIKRLHQERIGHCVGGKSKAYRTWLNMISRCTNSKVGCYSDYGGRGIKVCDRWLNSFAAFISDMGDPPSPKHQIDRWPNNDGNYEPGNCRWATASENIRNSRSVRLITFNSQTKPLGDWAKEIGLTHCGLIRRLRFWTVEKALTHSKIHAPVITHGAESKTVSEWAKSLGLTMNAIHFRIKNWGIEKALTTSRIEEPERKKRAMEARIKQAFEARQSKPNKPTLKKV